MKSGNKILLVLGIFAVLVFLWLIFAPLNDLNRQMNTMYTTPATANSTAIMSDNGTVPRFNTFQGGIVTSFLWIIAIGIVGGGVMLISNAFKGNGEP